jgi:hypothetical protein
MTTQKELMEIEKLFWTASDDPDVYRQNMAADALALINGEVKTRDDAIAMAGQTRMKWDNIRLENPRFVQISDDTAAVTYEGSADPSKGERFAAAVSSVYTRRDGRHVLVLTTHTPKAGAGTEPQREAVAAHTR